MTLFQDRGKDEIYLGLGNDVITVDGTEVRRLMGVRARIGSQLMSPE